MKSITETSILSVLLGGIVENAFEENVLLHDAFSLSRCNRAFLGFDESIDRSKIFVCVCEWKCERRVSYEEVSVFSKNVKNARFSRFRIHVVVQALGFMSASVLLPSRITFLLRIANHMVMDSCCRGGIVNIRCGRSRVLLERRPRPTALWRFRVSTSNSPSGRLWPQTNTLPH